MNGRIKIGFFDSGVGGICVMTCVRKVLPFADCIFYADTEHVPFGTKSADEIKEYATRAVSYLVGHGVDAVVIACNTATSIAIDALREKFSLPIVGMEPAIKPAVRVHPSERILVCATPVTIAGEKLHHLINDSGANPDLAPLPQLVTFAENEVFDTDTVCSYFAENIDKSRNYAAVVLGCTHFTYFKDSFRKYLGKVDIIDGTAGTVKRLISVLAESIDSADQSHAGVVEYVRSGVPVTDEEDIGFYEKAAVRAADMLMLN